MDFVKDPIHGNDYLKEEDPKLYISAKTGRGPLNDDWVKEYWADCEGKAMPTASGKAIMCAYKLCKVEVRLWGVQAKLERFVCDTGKYSTRNQWTLPLE